MKITVKATEQDIFEAHKLHWSKQRARWILILAGVFLIVTSLLSLFSGTLDSLDALILKSCVFLGVGIAFLFYKYTIVQIISKHEYKKTPLFHESRTYEITDKSLKVIGNSSKSETNWEAFVKVIYNNKILLLYYGPKSMIPIPRHSIKSDEEWDKLIELLQRKIKK